MNAEELLAEWEDGEQNGMRAARLRQVREDMVEATGEAIPKRLTHIDAMLSDPNWRGTVTRKLREAAEASDGSDE